MQVGLKDDNELTQGSLGGNVKEVKKRAEFREKEP